MKTIHDHREYNSDLRLLDLHLTLRRIKKRHNELSEMMDVFESVFGVTGDQSKLHTILWGLFDDYMDAACSDKDMCIETVSKWVFEDECSTRIKDVITKISEQ